MRTYGLVVEAVQSGPFFYTQWSPHEPGVVYVDTIHCVSIFLCGVRCAVEYRRNAVKCVPLGKITQSNFEWINQQLCGCMSFSGTDPSRGLNSRHNM